MSLKMSVILLPAQRPKGRMELEKWAGARLPKSVEGVDKSLAFVSEYREVPDDLHFLKSCFGPCADGDWAVEGV